MSDSTLARARAYWRLAAKARKNGQYAQAEHYTRVADKFHREYQRQKNWRKGAGQ